MLIFIDGVDSICEITMFNGDVVGCDLPPEFL